MAVSLWVLRACSQVNTARKPNGVKLGLFRDNGKENGSCYSILGLSKVES